MDDEGPSMPCRHHPAVEEVRGVQQCGCAGNLTLASMWTGVACVVAAESSQPQVCEKLQSLTLTTNAQLTRTLGSFRKLISPAYPLLWHIYAKERVTVQSLGHCLEVTVESIFNNYGAKSQILNG